MGFDGFERDGRQVTSNMRLPVKPDDRCPDAPAGARVAVEGAQAEAIVRANKGFWTTAVGADVTATIPSM